MPEPKKWSIKIVQGKAVVYIGETRCTFDNNGYILQAETTKYRGKSAIKLTFSGEKDAVFSLKCYDWSKSDGKFKTIVGEDIKKWEKLCNEYLKELDKASNIDEDEPCEDRLSQDDNRTPALSTNEDMSAKRKASSALLDKLTPPSKKKREEEDQTEAEKILEVQSHRVDVQYYIPVNQIDLPPSNRLLRNVDDVFLRRLITEMEGNPHGAYEPLYLHIKNGTKEEFDIAKASEYRYEVLGGTHNTLAAKELHRRHPEEPAFKGRYAWIFFDLSDEDALWLASRHNRTGSFRHAITFQDEVNVAYLQLPNHGDLKDGKYVPNTAWREACSRILGKDKKMLNEVFAVASLPEDGWKLFNTMCGKYEKGGLKKQRALPKDLKGKPTFRPVYIRCLLGLDVADRLELLNKVADEESSLDEMKAMAVDLKALRPVQKAIASSLRKPWDVVEQEYGDTVHPSILRRFIGKNESSVVMKEFLQRLQRSGVPEGKDEMDNEVIVHKTDGPLDIVQGKIKNDEGISLAIYRLPNNIEEQCLHGCIEKVLGLVARLNFGLKQFYNIVILGSVAHITKAEQRIRENYRGENEIGFYAWNTTAGSNNKSGNLGMISCVESFLIHHAAVGNNVLPEHFNFGEELVSNFIGNIANNNDILERLIRLFSQECDWILDINSSKASASLMALKTKRNAIYLCETNDEEFHVKRAISDTKRNRLDG